METRYDHKKQEARVTIDDYVSAYDLDGDIELAIKTLTDRLAELKHHHGHEFKRFELDYSQNKYDESYSFRIVCVRDMTQKEKDHFERQSKQDKQNRIFNLERELKSLKDEN